MSRGKFIIIEGGDGAGKDTQIDLLKKDFSGDRFVYTRELGGTPLGMVVRDMLFHESVGDVSFLAELFLTFADRAQHVEKVIAPALAAGKVVISNRLWLSGIAYQIYGRNHMDMLPFAEEMYTKIYKDCPLDLAILLDIPAEVGMNRQQEMKKNLDLMERQPAEFHERVRNGFLEAAAKVPSAHIIDGARSVEEVYADVKAAIEKAIAE